MKTSSFIIFLSIVITVLGLTNFYIYKRIINVIPAENHYRTIFTFVFIFTAASYILARFLERIWDSPIIDFLVWVGSFWLAAMLYLFLIFLFSDLLRLLNHWFSIFPTFITANNIIVNQVLAVIIFISLATLLISGYINADNPRIKKLDIKISKQRGALGQSYKIVMASDLHIGTMVSGKKLNEIVKMINSQNPDLILFAGDLVDEDISSVIRNHYGEDLRSLTAKYGIFAITGNHEYIGGVEAACKYLNNHNITMLRDSTALINNDFYVVGREDRGISGFMGLKRKSFAELLTGIDKSKPIIAMDHQPFDLNEAAEKGIDFQLSGHTHHGQIFPLNLLTNAIYEVSWGYKKIANTQYYVSSGLGTWGPPIRIGNTPELVVINLVIE